MNFSLDHDSCHLNLDAFRVIVNFLTAGVLGVFAIFLMVDTLLEIAGFRLAEVNEDLYLLHFEN